MYVPNYISTICWKHISVGSSWVSESRRLYRTTQNRIITIQLPCTTVASRNSRHRFHVSISPTRWQAVCHGFEWIFSLFFFLYCMLKIRHYRVLVIVVENDVDLSAGLCRAIISTNNSHSCGHRWCMREWKEWSCVCFHEVTCDMMHYICSIHKLSQLNQFEWMLLANNQNALWIFRWFSLLSLTMFSVSYKSQIASYLISYPYIF